MDSARARRKLECGLLLADPAVTTLLDGDNDDEPLEDAGLIEGGALRTLYGLPPRKLELARSELNDRSVSCFTQALAVRLDRASQYRLAAQGEAAHKIPLDSLLHDSRCQS